MKTKFIATFERIHQLFTTCPDPNRKRSETDWSVKEILGHLVDSASNNYQRLQRYVPDGELKFPGYDQEKCVRRANYAAFDYRDLISLWNTHNRLLFHLFDGIPAEDLGSKVKVGDNPAMSIEALMEDYFTHLALHEKQVKQAIESPQRADDSR